MRCKSFKKDRGFYFIFLFSLKGTGRESDWQTARSVNQAPLWHLQLGIWKWKPLKSVNLLSALKIPFSPPSSPPSNSRQLWKFKCVLFITFVIPWEWSSGFQKFGWQLCGNEPKIEFNLHLCVAAPSAVLRERQKSELEGPQPHLLPQLLSPAWIQACFLYPEVGGQELMRCTQPGVWREKVSYLNHFFSGCSFILNNAKVINLLEVLQNQCCKRLRMVPGKFKCCFMEAQVQQCKVW